MKTFMKMLAATVAAMGLGIVLIAYDASDRAVIATMFAGAILLSLLFGVFDEGAYYDHVVGGRTYRSEYTEFDLPNDWWLVLEINVNLKDDIKK